jgi:GDP-L-fucose synthase
MDLRERLDYPSWYGVDTVYLAAARVGGIGRNMREPGSMLYDNLMIQTNCIEAARRAGVKLFVLFGSSCIYPAAAPNPIPESALMTGPLEPTNSAYAVSKLAGIEMLRAYKQQYGMDYLVPMPCNLFGPGDSYDLDNCHLIPALIRKLHEAKEQRAASVTLWGTGTPRREIMHVDDMAQWVVRLVVDGRRGIVNVGTGIDLSIRQIAQAVATVVGFEGDILFDGDRSRDGVKRKLMKSDTPLTTSLGVRLSETYQGWRNNEVCRWRREPIE